MSPCCCSLVASDALHAVGACLCQASNDHGILQILKRLFLLLLQVLEPADELLLGHLELLSLTLILVDQLLFIVDLLSALGTRISQPLVLEVGDGALALGNHLADRFTLHSLLVLVVHVELLLALQVILQLLLDSCGTLHLRDVHVVAGVLDLLAPLLLAFEGLVAALALLLLSHLLIHLLLQGGTRNTNSKCQTIVLNF